MTAPAIFSFENIQVRTLGTSEFPLFVANDIAKALGYQNLVRTVNDRVDPEDLFKSEIETNGGRQLVNCVNESGLYALIFGSKLESAKRFKRWVTSEVLPAIRRQGYYAGPDYIDEAQQREIQKAVGRRASGAPKNFRVIYSALKDHFRIPRYTCLQKKDFEAALALIETCTLKPQLSAPAIPEGSIVIDEAMAEKIVVFIYYWRYLFRDDLNLFLALLRRVKSPLAAHFWEAVNDLGLGFMEDALAKQGYSVKDLSCYQHWASQQPKRLTA